MSTTSLGYLASGTLGNSNLQAALDTYIEDNGGNKVVKCWLYIRRTNVYAYSTYSSSVDLTITIDGTNTSTNRSITIEGGKQNQWQGPWLFAEKAFSGAAQTITISWVTTDNVPYSGTYQFSGSGSASVNVPASDTPPTGLTRTYTSLDPTSITAGVSVTGWGTGGSTAQHKLSLSVCKNQNTSSRNYTQTYPGNSTSASITVDNTSSTTHRDFTIQPNARYYLTQYAENGSAGTGNTSFTEIVTPCPAPTIVALTPYLTYDSSTGVWYATIRVDYTTNTGAGYLTTETEYRLRKSGSQWSQWWTQAEGTTRFWLDGLADDSDYEIQMKVTQSNGTSSSITTGTAHTPKLYKLYGSVGGKTKSINKLYCSVGGKTKLVTKLYGSVNGVTKRIF